MGPDICRGRAPGTVGDVDAAGDAAVAAGGERLEAPPSVVHWKFNAAPLSDRDLIYAIAAAVTESGAQVTYGYASVRDGWVASVLGKPVPGTPSLWVASCAALFYPLVCVFVSGAVGGGFRVDHTCWEALCTHSGGARHGACAPTASACSRPR